MMSRYNSHIDCNGRACWAGTLHRLGEQRRLASSTHDLALDLPAPSLPDIESASGQ
jgi:hypothetical protein